MTRIVDALSLTMPLEPEEAPVAGTPSSGLVELDSFAGVDYGVWELTPGTVTDAEDDELFVVLAGDATVRFEDGTSIDLGPGSVVRLHAGERTEWEVRETLRKVYFVGSPVAE
jgi:uncharacterized cupin superfamily protein